MSKYYQYDKATDKYVIAVKKSIVPEPDIELIMRSLVLIRKAVVWVDFGYNIGTEFGGRHPAIILKNLKDSLIVIPLSSQMPKTMDYNIMVDKVYGFPEMPRWANITRITQVSLSRVHFEKFGDVKPGVLKEIREKLVSCGITVKPSFMAASFRTIIYLIPFSLLFYRSQSSSPSLSSASASFIWTASRSPILCNPSYILFVFS